MTTMTSPRGGALTGRLILLLAVVAITAALASMLVLPSAVAVDRLVGEVGQGLFDVPPLPEELSPPAENSLVLAADGETVLAELSGVESRVLVDLADVPQVTQDAVIATEDAAFWSHNGVNHRAIVRAALANVESGGISQGGSTITQQYVRNLPDIELTERTLDRKIKEAIWAVQLEERLSKEEILEGYLNEVYLGEGVYGIGTAARYYFDRDVSDLTLAQSALLAGMIRSPEHNNPVDDPEAARARRDIVLDQMARLGMITPREAAEAQRQPVETDIQPRNGPAEPFFVEWVKRIAYDVDVDLQRDVQAVLGDDPQARRDAVFKGGLVIHTTLDPRLQDAADATIAEYLDDPLDDPLASIVTVEPGTGAVKAMAVGPKDFDECPEGRAVCEHTKVIPAVPGAGSIEGRQPGSSFKPFVIAAALEEGFSPGWTAETTSGQPIDGCTGPGGGAYRPVNYAGGGGGYLDMYEAVKRSSNVYHVKLAQAVGVEAVREMAARLGIEHSPNLDEEHFGPRSCSIALGTANVFPLEMANAYATLANGGTRCEPYAIARITDRRGNLLYQHENDCVEVLEEGIADRVTDILQGSPTPGGTAGYIRGQLGRQVAGKTGTTNDFKDAWFVGYVPQLATAAWVGYEYPTCSDVVEIGCGSLFGVEAGGVVYERVTGGGVPGRMWVQYMEQALDGVPVETFETPPPIPMARVPDVVGMDEDGARAALEAKDFRAIATTVTYWAPAGTVVAQSPPGGGEAWVGSIVQIRISDGTGEPPPEEEATGSVPDVLGLTEEEAVEVLTDAGYDPRVVDKDTPEPDEDGVVIAQSPAPGTEYDEGGAVIIAVGRYGPPGGDDGNGEPPADGGDTGGDPGNGDGGTDSGGDGRGGSGGDRPRDRDGDPEDPASPSDGGD